MKNPKEIIEDAIKNLQDVKTALLAITPQQMNPKQSKEHAHAVANVNACVFHLEKI